MADSVKCCSFLPLGRLHLIVIPGLLELVMRQPNPGKYRFFNISLSLKITNKQPQSVIFSACGASNSTCSVVLSIMSTVFNIHVLSTEDCQVIFTNELSQQVISNNIALAQGDLEYSSRNR